MKIDLTKPIREMVLKPQTYQDLDLGDVYQTSDGSICLVTCVNDGTKEIICIGNRIKEPFRVADPPNKQYGSVNQVLGKLKAIEVEPIG